MDGLSFRVIYCMFLICCCGLGTFFSPYFLSSIFANENKIDDINDWYGTCCSSASSLILSRIGRGMRMLITQSDLLKALYAAYSFNNVSMFITNNCCITFGIYFTFYTNCNTTVFTINYTIVFTIVNTNILTAVITGVMTLVWAVVLLAFCVLND